jgi:hypothetical protein
MKLLALLSFTFAILSNLPVTAEAKALEILDRHYGPHEREIFDLWVPDRKLPAPLVIYIHGGGWTSGSKDDLRKDKPLIEKYNKAGLAIAAINYRYLKHAPLQTIMREDIGGFVQFMRLHAKDFHIDPKRIMPFGYSAGGSASLWLATHDDIADPASKASRKHESSRVLAAAHLNAQVSYDFLVWYKLFGKELTDRFLKDQVWSRYHFNSLDDLYTPKGIEVRQDLDMYGNLSSDDPPILFYNSLSDEPEKDYNHFVHSPRHARHLGEKALKLNIGAKVLIQADGTGVKSANEAVFNFFTHAVQESRKKNSHASK